MESRQGRAEGWASRWDGLANSSDHRLALQSAGSYAPKNQWLVGMNRTVGNMTNVTKDSDILFSISPSCIYSPILIN